MKDYDSPGTARAQARLYNAGAYYYSPGSITFYPSSASTYNGTLYRRDWNAEDGYYYTPVSMTLYTGYSSARLSFADEYGNGYTFREQTTITPQASVTGGTSTTKTVLAQGSSRMAQNFAFDGMEDVTFDDYNSDIS